MPTADTLMTAAAWPRQLMSGLLIAGLIFFVMMDLWAAYEGGAATISEIVISFYWRHPVCPFIMGAICGHLTWPKITVRPYWQTILMVAFTVIAAVAIFYLDRIPPMLPVWPLLLGIGYGHQVWPQRTVSAEMGMVEMRTPSAITSVPAAVQRE